MSAGPLRKQVHPRQVTVEKQEVDSVVGKHKPTRSFIFSPKLNMRAGGEHFGEFLYIELLLSILKRVFIIALVQKSDCN